MPYVKGTLRERFEMKVSRIDGGCWIWEGFLDRHGYGYFRGRTSTLAHRTAYELYVGDVPAGLVLDHLCQNPACVNPNHLEPITQGENLHRVAARRTHCNQGHEYTPDNIYWHKGARYCRVCQREYSRKKRVRQRAARKAGE